jgi:hypothetical protein
MDPSLDAARFVLYGTLVAAAAGAAHSIATAILQSRGETNRLLRQIAVDTGFKEWERLSEMVEERGGQMYPPPLFISFNVALFKLIFEDKLTAESYRRLVKKRDELKAVIADTQPKPK